MSIVHNIDESSKGTIEYYYSLSPLSLPQTLVASSLCMEMQLALDIARKAGTECLFPLRNSIVATLKEEKSLSSIADYQSNEMIFNLLHQHFPKDGFISQEGVPQHASVNHAEAMRIWVVDALDGSSAYAKGNSDAYGIHIALVDAATGEPLLGVNHYPARDTSYFAIKNCGAYKQIGKNPAELLKVSSFTNAFHAYSSTMTSLITRIYESLENVSFSECESCGLRICSQLDTPNNLYITSGHNTHCGEMEGPVRFTATWDLASGAVILSEAGGVVAYIDGSPIDYRASDGRLTQTVVVTSDPAHYSEIQKIYKKLILE